METERLYKKLPKTSKSAIRTYKYFCDYLFYRNVILQEKQEEGSNSVKCDVGTDTHMIFSDFWSERGVDAEYLFSLDITPMFDLDNNPVTHYFYGVCIRLTPVYDREVEVLKRIFWKFARLHASRFLNLYKTFNGNKIKVWNYFAPMEVEQFYYIKRYGLYGTIDTIFKDVDIQLNEIIYLPDYKTGSVPASVIAGPIHPGDDTSTKLPTKFMFECHFYGLLWLLAKGWDFEDNLMEKFIVHDLYLDVDGTWKMFGLGKTKEEQKAIDKAKGKYLTRTQPMLRRFNEKLQLWEAVEHGDILLGIIFLSGDPLIPNPIVVKKKFNLRSLRTALISANEIKTVYRNIENDEFYLIKKMKTRPEYNQYKCINCSRNTRCLLELEQSFKKRF